MGRVHEVGIGADTRPFEEGIRRGVIEPVEDAERALEELGDSGGPEQLERDLKDAQDATEKLAAETKDTARTIERSYHDARQGIKKGIGAGLDEAKDEARQSGREAAASFSGEFDDVTDFVQETVANGLGPAGIAGAAVIGAVVATATAAVEDWDEKIQGIKDATAAMWQEAAEGGQTFLDAASIQSEAYRLLWDETYKDQFEAAEKAGIKRSELALALAQGEGEAFERVTAMLGEAFRDRQRAGSVYGDTLKEQGDAARAAAEREAGALGATLGLLSEKQKQVELNKQLTREAAEVTKLSEQQQREQTARTFDAAQSRYEALAELYSKPIKTTVDVEVNDRTVGQVERIVQRINGRIASIQISAGINGRRVV